RAGPEERPAASPGTPPRDALQIEIGNALQARFVREGAGDTARVVRGAIRIAEPGPAPAEAVEPALLPASGVTASVALARLNVDEWEAMGDRLLAAPARANAAAPALDAGAGAGY